MDPRQNNGGSAERANILTKKSPAIGRGVATAVVTKDADVYLITNRDGNLPLQGPHGFGLYHHDCRFLDGYTIEIDGHRPIVLASTAAEDSKAMFELTNPELPRQGGGTLDKHEIALRWDRIVDGHGAALHEVIRIKSFAWTAADITITLSFQSSFEDVYAVRGLCAERPGELHPPSWEGDRLRLRYDGADGTVRRTDVQLWRHPDGVDEKSARFALHLEPGAEEEIALSISLHESPRDAPPPAAPKKPDLAQLERRQRALGAERRQGYTEVRADHPALERVVARSLRDLAMLRSELSNSAFYAAGVPWFVALFGRDSILVALQTLAYDPEMAAETLRLLACHQGRADDPSRDEEPGKILHEYRVGELAHVGAIPHTPYYGTVDATPLFLVLVARHAAWTGSMDLFHELRPNVDAALEWISKYGQSKTSGWVEYRSRATGGLANQGWKDSGDAIVMANGELARQPIALVEVQGYVYLAKTLVADLFARAGEPERAAELRREAESMKERFLRDYWLSDEGFFALALTPDGPAKVLSSNVGQALWSGIVRPEEARPTMESLTSDAMWSGWGIRTLSEHARRFNPVAYHRGTVWPHDNAIIAAGLRRCGFDDAACQVFEGIVEASTHFPLHRLPELFAGFRRSEYGIPVRYPVACHPQAWAAASVPFMLERLLGLTPEAFENRLRVVRPILPPSTQLVELRGLRVGSARVDLHFTRQPDGHADVEVLKTEGDVEVEVEPNGTELGC
jgi:glycogen debranching enzyme